jgi:hypothetical protein
MKILVAKHCSNIRFAGKETNGGQTEIIVTIKLLQRMGHKIDVATLAKYSKDAPEKVNVVEWHQAVKNACQGEYDAVFMFNGVFNCFGGVISDESLYSYNILNLAHHLPIIYAVTDTAIPIGNCADWIRGAQSKGKYTNLTPELYEVPVDKIYCLTQTYDLDVLKKIWKTKENAFKHYAHFPFETTVLFRENLQTSVGEPDTDLIYFGNPRGGKRDKKFVKYYCNQPDLKVDVYGNWTETHQKNLNKKGQVQHFPTFHGKCDMYELHGKINRSIAHCYISDPNNERTIWTTRFYEAIMNRSILFMDLDNDPEMKMFKDPFFYVRDGKELKTKILQLKLSPELRKQKLDAQLLSLSSIARATWDYGEVLESKIKEAGVFYGKNL